MEAQMLLSNGKKQQQQQQEDEDEEGGARVLYRASFEEKEELVLGYESAQWVLLSLVLLLAWGVGLLMLLYLPFRRYAVRQDVRSRKLYVTSTAIVYKSAYGIHSVKIENASRRKPPPGDDLQIIGVDNPRMFRKVVLMALSNLRRDQGADRRTGGTRSVHDELVDDHASFIPEKPSSQNWAWQQGTGLSSWQMSYSPMNEIPHESPCVVSGDVLMGKLDDIENSLKRIEVFVEQPQTKSMDTPQKTGKEDLYTQHVC